MCEQCNRMEKGIHQIKRQLENFWAVGDCEDNDAELQDFVEKAYEKCLTWAPNDIDGDDGFEIDETPVESSETERQPFEPKDVEVDVPEENLESESDEDVENIED